MTDSTNAIDYDSVASEIKDSDLVFAYLPEYQDGDLSGALKERFEKLLKAENENLLEDFTNARGNFQLAFNSCSLDTEQLQKLRTFVEDDVSRADHEAGNIKKVGQTELRGNTMRAVILISMVFLVFCIGYYYVGPAPKPTFNALETLVYEAVVMTEDDGRLDFPTEHLSEVRNYVARYPKLGFTPYVVNALPGWKLEGATVIDYDFAKIPVVQYSNSVLDDKLFIFQYKGHMSDLASAEEGKYNDLIFQTYSDDRVNIIAWQVNEDVVGMMIGSRGATELAKLARTSSMK